VPAFLPYGTPGGAHRDDLAGQVAAAIGRIYADAEQQISRLAARLAARVLRGGLQPGIARRRLTALAAVILARAAEQAARELAAAGQRIRAAALSAAAAGLGSAGLPRHQGSLADAARETGDQLGQDPGWGTLQDRLDGAGIAAVRSAAAALSTAADAGQGPSRGTRLAIAAEAAITVTAAVLDMPVQLAAYTDTAGRTWRLGTYARAAAGAAAAWLHVAWQMTSLRAAGLGLVRVDGPSGGATCPKCAPWAGKILSLTGLDSGGLADGTLADALAAGLIHPHCRHDLTPVT